MLLPYEPLQPDGCASIPGMGFATCAAMPDIVPQVQYEQD